MPVRFISEEIKTEVLRLRLQERMTAPQIAKRVGICNQSAYGLLSAYPLTAEEMSKRRRSTSRCWSDEERRVLKRFWLTGDKAKIIEALPKRKWASISKMALELGLRRSMITAARKKRRIDPIFLQLRAIREAKRLIREELAEKVGVHRQMIAHFELGQTVPRWANLRAWAEALECDLVIVPRQARN